MRVTRNEKLIKRRARLGTYTTLAGLGVLVAGMIVSFQGQGQAVWISMVALIVGFILSQFGNYNLRRWGRNPRPDQAIETSLKGFDDRYHFYAWALPAPYVLLSPQGVFSFVTRDQTGQVSVNGSQWRTKFSLGRALLVFAQEGLGNPSREAIDQAARLEKWIKSSLPDVEVNVQPAVVFINERVQLQINEPEAPVLEAKGIKKWLRGGTKRDSIRVAEYRALEELFNAAGAR